MKVKPSRKELEAKLKALEAKVAGNQKPDDPLDQCGHFYDLCIESAPYGIIAHDDEGGILIFDSKLERVSGYCQEEFT